MANKLPSTKAGRRGGKRPGSGRKLGAKNKVTLALKEFAGQFTEEAVMVLVDAMRDPEAPQAVKIQAADKLLDRGHGRPAINVEQIEVNIRQIPWDELRQISQQALDYADQQHKAVIEGRAERLGIRNEYKSED